MFVRLLTGRFKGELAEMKFSDAQPLIADGRAERAYQDEPATALAVEESEATNEGQNSQTLQDPRKASEAGRRPRRSPRSRKSAN